MAANVNGSFFYFGYDALGSQIVVLNTSGSVIGAQLYGPYGNPRYSTGTLPTSIGFTGQHTDSVTGLDYYNARYYDPVVGQFLSADIKQGNAQGTDPYSYVGGNPETRIDPSGQRYTCTTGGGGCGNSNSGGGIVLSLPQQSGPAPKSSPKQPPKSSGGGGGTKTGVSMHNAGTDDPPSDCGEENLGYCGVSAALLSGEMFFAGLGGQLESLKGWLDGLAIILGAITAGLGIGAF